MIVLPEFLKGEDAARLIPHVTAATLAEGTTRAGEALFLREVPHSTLGPLHVVFRNRPATAADLGHAPDDLFPEVVTEGFVSRGAEPRQAYSRAHLEAASNAVSAKLKQCEESKTWGEGDALCDLKLELGADASPKVTLTGVHGNNGSARAYYEDLRGAWQAKAQEARRQVAVATRAGEGAATWTAKLRRALPESSSGRALVFGTVAAVALGSFLAGRHWRREPNDEAREL